ncbi:uncharacterized protein LOC143039336 [Oratosquilla oratoria]|uniref:uncharacterized protein LOC143039336 n=1 Tax=Oratosquilla oratoria TaxID=337810 RepID=UPI003F77765E
MSFEVTKIVKVLNKEPFTTDRVYKTFKMSRICLLLLLVVATVVIIDFTSTRQGWKEPKQPLRIMVSAVQKVFEGNSRTQRRSNFEARLDGPLAPDDPELLEWVVDGGRHLRPPSLLPYNLTNQDLKHDYRTTPSWAFYNESLHALMGSKIKDGGIFLEAGALNGIFLSNTFHLEQDYGWTGLLVEAAENNFKNLMYKHRKAWASDLCLAGKPFPYKMLFWQADSDIGYYLEIKRGLSASIEALEAQDDIRGVPYIIEKGVFRSVQCIPLYTLLLASNISRIDFWSLDVEGAESGILSTFPFQSVEVQVLGVEHKKEVKPFVKLVERLSGLKFYELSGEDFIFVQPHFLQ